MTKENPNIIVVIADSLRADHIGLYGYNRNTTPNLDRLVKNGIVFENCYANSFWSVPSHASMFSGKLPSEHQMVESKNPWFDEKNKLADIDGYTTYLESSNPFLTKVFGFTSGFDHAEYNDKYWRVGDSIEKKISQAKPEQYSNKIDKYFKTLKNILSEGPVTAAKISLFIGQRRLNDRIGWETNRASDIFDKIFRKDLEAPFLMVTNVMDIHDPYKTPLAFSRKYSNLKTMLNNRLAKVSEEELSAEELQKSIDLYDDCIRYTDREIGKFVEKMEEKYPKTIFVITSDHGELFQDNDLDFEERKRGHKSSCSEAILKVPLIVYGKNIEHERRGECISLLELPALIQSILADKKFDPNGFAISENVSKKDGRISKRITDGENTLISLEGDKHYYGDNEKAEKLEENLETRSREFKGREIQNIDV